MTDAEKREKVIRGLEAHCKTWEKDGMAKCLTNPDMCPYHQGMPGCTGVLAANALDLLREQEPRVLSKSEAEQYVTSGITDGYSETPPLYVEYKKYQRYYLKWVTLETAYSWMTDYGTSSVYGSELRFWTSRPSEQQMRDTPWEGESDD